MIILVRSRQIIEILAFVGHALPNLPASSSDVNAEARLRDVLSILLSLVLARDTSQAQPEVVSQGKETLNVAVKCAGVEEFVAFIMNMLATKDGAVSLSNLECVRDTDLLRRCSKTRSTLLASELPISHHIGDLDSRGSF